MTSTNRPPRGGAKVEKMPRLPKHVKVQKRPLLHPQIASPYAGKGSPKIVYVGSKTPFVSALKRVRQHLNHISKRELQSELSRQKQTRSNGKLTSVSGTKEHEPEAVIITATGKAIDKALSLALCLQNQNDTAVKIMTTSAAAVDDIVPSDEYLSQAKKETGSDSEAGGVALGAEVDMVAASKAASKRIDPAEGLGSFLGPRIRHTSVIQVSVTTR